MKEAVLVRKIMEWARSLPNTFAYKFHGTPYSCIGMPDLMIIHSGIPIFAEVKVGRNKLTKTQELRLEQLRAAGAHAIVVRDSMQPLKDLVESIAKHEDSAGGGGHSTIG